MDTYVQLPTEIIQYFQQSGQLITLQKGQYLFQEGMKHKQIFMITDGTIQINKENSQGRALTLRLCGQKAIIGENALFCQTATYTTSAKTINHCEVRALPTLSFEKFLLAQPTLLTSYVQWLQIENEKHQSRLRDLLLHGKKGALYSTLIRLANTYGEASLQGIVIRFFLNNTDIANLCGTSREVINRLLNDLKKQSIVSFEQGIITIHQLDYLKQQIACENCPLYICRID